MTESTHPHGAHPPTHAGATSVVGGESMLREILHAHRIWKEQAAQEDEPPTFARLETSELCASLPQILCTTGLAGLIVSARRDDVEWFPHSSWIWRGLDGSEVLAHRAPCGTDGVAPPSDEPREPPDRDGSPRCVLTPAGELLSTLESLAQRGDLPVWDGELPLSDAAQRQVRAELDLRLAEMMTFAGPTSIEADASARALIKLDRAWRLALLDQRSGDAGATVREDASVSRDERDRLLAQVLTRATKQWGRAFDTTQADEPALVINPADASRSGVFELETDDGPRLKFAKRVPALGARVVDLRASSECVPVVASVSGDGPDRRVSMGNGVIEAVIDVRARVLSLARVGGREVVPEATASVGLNALCVYADLADDPGEGDGASRRGASARPIDDACAAWELVEAGPLRARLRTEREMDEGRVAQEFVLDAGSPRLDVRTRVTWRSPHAWLGALFPVDVRSIEATYGVPFGHARRPTHRNTPADAAMGGMSAHGWCDLSQPGLGVALLDDGRCGRSCRENVMGITLHGRLDGGAADAITYSLMPHEGDWRAAGVDVEAALLNSPMRARELPIDQTGPAGECWSPVELVYADDTTARLEIAAIKRAQVSEALIVRVVEVRGGRGEVAIRWGLDVAGVRPVDGLERAIDGTDQASWLDGGCTMLDVSAFEIITLEVTLA